MVSTKAALKNITTQVDESMGVRQLDHHPQFSPKPSPQDLGRLPLRSFGRVDVDRIIPDLSQPRATFDPEEIQQLARSIRERGQLQPIRVRWHADTEQWMIVIGERRFQATKAAGLQTIDCCFVDDDLTTAEILEQQLIENLLRQDLRPLEEAQGYAQILQLNGWNGKQVAEALRVSPAKVSRGLALLDLPAEVQAQIERGELPRSAAYEIAKLDSAPAQSKLAQRAAATGFTQKQTAAAVRQRRGKRVATSRGTRQTFQADNGWSICVSTKRSGTYHDLELALRQALEEVRLRIDNNVKLY